VAVYTALSADQLAAWLASHDVGTLVDFRGIAAGIENSNFFVTTDDAGIRRPFVLTIFERMTAAELTYDLALMKHLASYGIPCPDPMPDRDGALCATLVGKPAALVTRLPGRSVLDPDVDHCRAMGRTLGAMHRAAAHFRAQQRNPRGADWWLATGERVRGFLDESQCALLDAALADVAVRWDTLARDLPTGAVHADLFRDNALFVDGDDGTIAMGGVIDFYFAGDEAYVFDLAVCLNDWCVDLAVGTFDATRALAFVDAYAMERPLGDAERDVLPLALCAAALRFWLSRVDDLHRPRPAELLTPHDPTHFERILRRRHAEALDATGPFARPRSTPGIAR
jgi:homoserine kinase type II